MATFFTQKNGKRTRNIFDPKSAEPFKLSRSKLDLFLNCPRCFYLDRRRGVGRPSGPPFNLNIHVDTLLKKEFDMHRAKAQAHPLMKEYGIDAIPFAHEKMDEWRENFKGVRYLHEPTNLLITGAVDDIWVNPEGDLHVVDYKATANKEKPVTALDQDWHIGYKRQMEIYQWLLRHNGHRVSDMGYFVYCTGRSDCEAFDGKLEFEVVVIPYTGKDDWVEDCIAGAHACLVGDEIPQTGEFCEYCAYTEAIQKELS